MTEERPTTGSSGATGVPHPSGIGVPRRVTRSAVLAGVSTALKGAHLFRLKVALMRVAGYRVGEGAKIVGPVRISTMRELQIGANTWVGTNLTFHGNGMVRIGDNCDLAPDIAFLAGTHLVGNAERRADEGRNTEISVGNGCWIGARSTILGGLHVGDGSVVGACSLVNRDVKPNSLVGGVGDVVEGLRMAGRGEPAGRSFARMPRRCDDQPRVVTHSRGPLPRTSVVGTHSLRESS